jgi:hypothetical protein
VKLPNLPKCSNPRGAKYCADPECPARDKMGNHIVVASIGNDLDKSFALSKNKPMPAKPKPLPTPQYVPAPKPHETDITLFDDNSDLIGSEVYFNQDAVGTHPVFYCNPNEEYIIAVKLSWARKKDIHIISRGAMRIQYGTHIIRTSKQLITLGINSDLKLARAVSKNLITILQEPKFEAVHIKYLGRKDETRTQILPSNSNMAELIFQSIKYMQQP